MFVVVVVIARGLCASADILSTSTSLNQTSSTLYPPSRPLVPLLVGWLCRPVWMTFVVTRRVRRVLRQSRWVHLRLHLCWVHLRLCLSWVSSSYVDEGEGETARVG